MMVFLFRCAKNTFLPTTTTVTQKRDISLNMSIVCIQGTVQPVSDFDADAAAQTLKDAMKGFGKATVLTIL